MRPDEPTPLEEVLHEIETEERDLNHAALVRWVEKYPEYRNELTDFFATRATRGATPAMTEEEQASAGRRMVSKALNLLHKQRAAAAAGVQAEPTGTPLRLCDAVKESGLTEEEFQTRSGLDDLLVSKLDRRLIRYLSIPLLCFERIAEVLARRLEDICMMLSGNPILLPRHKAKKRPEETVQDFADAVRLSNLSDPEKAVWLAAVDQNTSTGSSE
ncbi:MAG: hypothetical protein U0804_01460 [Gemmataceae bacterium]